MSQQEKDTAFFRALLSGHGEAECRNLQSRLHETERNQKSVQRATFLACFLGLCSLVGWGYSALFWPEILEEPSHFLVRLFSVSGLTSMICLAGFLVCWIRFRQIAHRVHDECRAFFLGTLNESFRAANSFLRAPTVESPDSPLLQLHTDAEEEPPNLMVLPRVS